MKERPILFSGEMVRAILDGRKTQTRRAVTPTKKHATHVGCIENNSGGWQPMNWFDDYFNDEDGMEWPIACQYGAPGDRLWVRETFRRYICPRHDEGQPPCRPCLCHRTSYRADYKDSRPGGWRPSIFMPRGRSRITLEVTGVRVERLQEISDEDIQAEGVRSFDKLGVPHMSRLRRRIDFEALWDSINRKRPGSDWESNPWVWVVEFRRIDATTQPNTATEDA